MAGVAANAGSGIKTTAPRSRLNAATIRMAIFLAYGLLLAVALSIPAIFVPGTRIGALLAAALLTGAIASRGRSWPLRLAWGSLMGLLLGGALSVAAWALLSDAPDAALWQATGLNVAANSTIRPVDEALGSWLSGYELLEDRLLYIRFAVSNLLLGLVGGLGGGLLASGRPRPRVETVADVESTGEEKKAEAVEATEDPGDGSEDAPYADAAQLARNGGTALIYEEEKEPERTGEEDTDPGPAEAEDSDADPSDGEDPEPEPPIAEEARPTPASGGTTPGAARRRRLLLWAGGGALAAVVVVVVVVALLLAGGGGGGTLPAGPLGLVSDDASWVQVVDVQLLLGEGPDDYVDGFEDAWEDRLDDIEISLDDLNTLVQAWGEEWNVTVFDGEFDFEQVRDELDDARYDDDSYRGYEIWSDGELWVDAIALLDERGEVVIGNADDVEDVLQALSRSSGSLLQDDGNDLLQALERAGQGWLVAASDGCADAYARRCEALGAAASRGSERYVVETTLAYLFRDDRSAESGMDDLEDYLDDRFPRHVDIEEVRSDGAFVIVTTSTDVDDWVGPFP